MYIYIHLLVIYAVAVFVVLLAYAYTKQKLINSFLMKELQIKEKLKSFKARIYIRQSYLNRYDFQLYNLGDVLIEQEHLEA